MTWPGHIEGGRTTDHISAFWDFLPTLADDPAEQHDVASEHPDIVERFNTILQTARTESPISEFN